MLSRRSSHAYFLRRFVAGLALFLVSNGLDAAQRKPFWLAVVRPELAEPLKALAEMRRSDGLEVVVSTKSVNEALKDAPQRPEFLLLVGDDEARKENAPWYLPAKRRKLYRWRSVQRQEYASDAAWGDLDGHGVPRIPVGRIPARSRAQVKQVVRKILAYESQPPTIAERRCQAKSLLFLPGGPVATIGATTESHPLTNDFSGACLLTAVRRNFGRLVVI